MDVTTDFLRTLIAVCECKSFSRAAARVHKSQAAISTQIAKLEAHAGSKFIDRSQRQFRLTVEGELFLNFAHEMVAKTDAAQRSLAALKNNHSLEVRIGAARSVGIYVLPGVIGEIAKTFPNIKLTVTSQARTAIYERLQQGIVDIAVVLSDTAPREFDSVALRPEPLYFVISPKHPLANKKIISKDELQTIPYIYGLKGNGFSDLVDQAVEKLRIPKPIEGISISNLRARKEAARAGVGVTVLPHFIVQGDVRRKTLKILTVTDGALPDAHLMIVQSDHRSPNTNVELVKKALIARLAVARRRQH